MDEPIDMTVKMAEVRKEPQLVLDLVPNHVVDLVFPLMKPYAQDLAEKSLGEYTVYDVYMQARWGTSHLFLGYIVPDVEAYRSMDLMTRILDPKVEKEFAGYVLVKHSFNEKAPHIWQAVIIPKYQGTNILEIGCKYLEEEFRKIGIGEVSMSSLRAGWHDTAAKLGFAETFTIYRKKLSQE